MLSAETAGRRSLATARRSRRVAACRRPPRGRVQHRGELDGLAVGTAGQGRRLPVAGARMSPISSTPSAGRGVGSADDRGSWSGGPAVGRCGHAHGALLDVGGLRGVGLRGTVDVLGDDRVLLGHGDHLGAEQTTLAATAASIGAATLAFAATAPSIGAAMLASPARSTLTLSRLPSSRARTVDAGDPSAAAPCRRWALGARGAVESVPAGAAGGPAVVERRRCPALVDAVLGGVAVASA